MQNMYIFIKGALADFDKKPENPPVLTGAEGVSASKQPPGAKPVVHPVSH